jgi:hypothetical protein
MLPQDVPARKVVIACTSAGASVARTNCSHFRRSFGGDTYRYSYLSLIVIHFDTVSS